MVLKLTLFHGTKLTYFWLAVLCSTWEEQQESIQLFLFRDQYPMPQYLQEKEHQSSYSKNFLTSAQGPRKQ